MKKTTVKQTTSKQDAANPELPGKVEAKVNPEAKQDHDPAIRILKIATCPSVSGKSTLTYHVGCTPASEIKIRVSANSGGGYFSQEWIALASIQEALNRQPDDPPITSFVLRGLFRGKSVNTAGFVMAVLKHAGLVRHMEEKERCYESVDPAPFIAEVETLIKSSVDLPAGEMVKPSASSKKPVAVGKPKAV